MKLKACHIENYGKIKDADYIFADGITQYCEENGYGKTTLASFLKAMFYGLSPVNKRTKQFLDREHFYPFHGGKFGGSLVFEKEGKEYRIERFFDKSSGTKDSMLVYCNGMPTEEFGGEIGQGVFGLDEEAFARTVFVTAAEMEMSATSGISAKLNCYVENTDSTADAASAIKLLHDRRKELRADRGSNDLLTRQREKISGMQEQIENLEQISAALGGQYTEREQLEQQIREAEAADKEAGTRKLLRQKWETYDGYQAALAAEREKREAISQKYPMGIPTQEELQELRGSAERLSMLKGERAAASPDGKEQERLEAFAVRFAGGVPEAEALRQEEERLAQIGSLRLQLEELKKGAQTERQRALSEKFAAGVPDREERDELQRLLTACQEKEEELETAGNCETQKAGWEQTKKRAGRAAFILESAAVLLLAGGGFFLAGKQDTRTGSLLFLLGAAAFAAGIVVFCRQRRKVAALQHTQEDAFAALRQELAVLESGIREKLARYGYHSRNGAVYDFAVMKQEAAEYEDFLAEAERKRERFEEKAAECRELLEQSAFFLEQYGEDMTLLREDFRNMQTAFGRLREDIRDYERLRKEEAEKKKKEETWQKQYAEIKEQMQSVLAGYRLEVSDDWKEQLARWGNDRLEAELLEESIAGQEKRLEEYRIKNGLSQRPEGEAADMEALRVRQSQMRRELAELDRRIAESEALLEKLPEKQNELALAEEKLEAYKEKHLIYAGAAKALETAEQALKDKYISPIKERFCIYSAAIERAIGERITMDKDFQLFFERGGENRKDRHLSAGERSVCALCFRLALIDNMYGKEQPFLIMDDPFVHLDAVHMKKTGEVLKELAKERQILYFCCHESRKV